MGGDLESLLILSRIQVPQEQRESSFYPVICKTFYEWNVIWIPFRCWNTRCSFFSYIILTDGSIYVSVSLISLELKCILNINYSSYYNRVYSIEEREDQIDRLDFIRNQMNLLTLDVKKKIREVTEEVANKVGNVSFVIISGKENTFYSAKNIIHLLL